MWTVSSLEKRRKWLDQKYQEHDKMEVRCKVQCKVCDWLICTIIYTELSTVLNATYWPRSSSRSRFPCTRPNPKLHACVTQSNIPRDLPLLKSILPFLISCSSKSTSSHDGRRHHFSNKDDDTTDTLESAIAAPAPMGGSIIPPNGRKIPMANGRPKTL